MTTKGLASELTELGLPSDRLKVAPNAVDARKLDRHLDRHEAKEGLDLDRLQPVAAYVGHLYPWKGVDTLLACARELPEILFLLVGGTPNDIERVRGQVEQFALGNVRVEGHVAPSRVSEYLAAADVLLLPNSGRSRLSAKDSALKAFEYMAARRPIIASDVPSLREIFQDEVNALLVPADDPHRLALAIRRVIEDPALGDRLAMAAREDAHDFTWDRRAAAILDFAGKISEESSRQPL